MTTPVAYTLAGAATATGYSIDVIRRAVRKGDLVTHAPKVGGTRVARPVILHDDLMRWLAA